jgi:hypothetical protein
MVASNGSLPLVYAPDPLLAAYLLVGHFTNRIIEQSTNLQVSAQVCQQLDDVLRHPHC